jgi:hypothetical protein
MEHVFAYARIGGRTLCLCERRIGTELSVGGACVAAAAHGSRPSLDRHC